MINEHPAYIYAEKVVKNKLVDVNGVKTKPPKYVVRQSREFLRIANGKDRKWHISELKLRQINGIMKLLIMPKGLKAGESFFNCTTAYQWLLIVAILCTVSRDDDNFRKYQRVVLEIGRKNFKTYTIAIIFIILFLTEPKFSKFYSVAPDGSLSREVREAISETVKSSPLIYEYHDVKRFKILRDYIQFIPTETKYVPLNYTNSRFDGKLPNAFLADEVGALPSSYAIESMSSGQLNIKNKLACIISTKYPTIDNPFEDEVDYAKKVLDGLIEDETLFALLYEPNNTKNWMSDDEILRQANPVALESPEIWSDLLKKRARAIALESARENFLTKHCNIIYQGAGTETFIDVKHVQKCRREHIDWNGRMVYIGVDLAMTTDNVAVGMVSNDNGTILADAIAFIPADRVDEKSKEEKIDYQRFINAMKCIACGDLVVDYSVIEDFVFNIEDTYNVVIAGIAFDRFNALSSAQKWDEKYVTCPLRQVPLELHPPTKLLQEKIFSGDFAYEKNDLLEINFQNAKCTFDSNMNMMINKKKSRGKVDMVAALVDAVFLLQQNEMLSNDSFVSQVV